MSFQFGRISAKGPNKDETLNPSKQRVEVITPPLKPILWFITDFPTEVVGSIADFLPWWCLTRLFCTGSKKLHPKLLSETGVRRIRHFRDDYRFTNFPSMVNKFVGLKTIELVMIGPEAITVTPEVRPDGLRALSSLPREMIHLSLTWNKTFGALPKTVFDVDSPFAALQSLHLSCLAWTTETGLLSLPWLFQAVPSSLTRLHVTFSGNGASWSEECSVAAHTLPLSLESLFLQVDGKADITGWVRRLVALERLELPCLELDYSLSDQPLSVALFPSSLTSLLANRILSMEIWRNLPDRLSTLVVVPHVDPSTFGFRYSPSSRHDHQIPDDWVPCWKYIRRYDTFLHWIPSAESMPSIAIPPLLESLTLRGTSDLRQFTLEMMQWKAVATLTELNLGPFFLDASIFPQALPPNLTKLSIQLMRCCHPNIHSTNGFGGGWASATATFGQLDVENPRVPFCLQFPSSLTYLHDLGRGYVSPSDIFKWLPTRASFPGPLAYLRSSNRHEIYMRAHEGYVSDHTQSEWAQPEEAAKKDLPILLDAWWHPPTRSFGPLHETFQSTQMLEDFIQHDATKCLNWLTQNAPGIISTFAVNDRMRPLRDPEIAQAPHSEQIWPLIAFKAGHVDVYKWLTANDFRGDPKMIHTVLDHPWNPDLLKWMSLKGSNLDIPNHMGLTPLTRILLSPQSHFGPEIKKFEFFASLGASALSWDPIIRKMLEQGNLDLLNTIQNVFPTLKHTATFQTLRTAFGQAKISNSASSNTISILNALVHSNILLTDGPDVQKSAQAALEQILLKTMPTSPDWLLSIFKWFISLGIDINNTPYFGLSGNIVHYGAVTGNISIVEFLHSLGVNWNQLDSNEQSPLKIAEGRGFTEVSDFLRPLTTIGSLEWDNPTKWDSSVLNTVTRAWTDVDTTLTVHTRKSNRSLFEYQPSAAPNRPLFLPIGHTRGQSPANSTETNTAIGSTSTTLNSTTEPKPLGATSSKSTIFGSSTTSVSPFTPLTSLSRDIKADEELGEPIYPVPKAKHPPPPKTGTMAKRPLNSVFGRPKAAQSSNTNTTNDSEAQIPPSTTAPSGLGATAKRPFLNAFKFGPPSDKPSDASPTE